MSKQPSSGADSRSKSYLANKQRMHDSLTLKCQVLTAVVLPQISMSSQDLRGPLLLPPRGRSRPLLQAFSGEQRADGCLIPVGPTL